MVTQWLALAREDLLAGESILTAPLSSYGTASFHAQQAAEKALKALLVKHQTEFSKSHNIGQLLRLAEPPAPGISERLESARTLTPYAVTVRYPGEGPLPDRDEAADHLALARRVVDEVVALLDPYLEAGPPAV